MLNVFSIGSESKSFYTFCCVPLDLTPTSGLLILSCIGSTDECIICDAFSTPDKREFCL